ncbi:MAG TPA: M48 family metalloprotease [Pyrinomonadaceae bacterium]|nr:M48 family metalloprotease [Pyrinomonadaceae bacterium]
MHRKFSLLIVLLMICLLIANGQQFSRDQAKEQHIIEELSAIDPSAVPDFKAATAAMDAEKYDEAVTLYEAVRKKAPEFDHGLRRLGISLTYGGHVAEGLEFLEQAVNKRRSPENLISLAQALAYPGEGKQGTAEQRQRAYLFAVEANSKPKTGEDADYQILLADLSLSLGHDDVFRQTTKKLVATNPDLMQTHYFNAILQAYDENWILAENEIKRAESRGLPHDVTQRFLDSGVHTQASVRRYAWYAFYLVLAWIGGLVSLLLLGKLMSAQTLRSIENADPNGIAAGSDLWLRKFYRWLVNVGGVYYYLSIPFVIFLVVGVAGGLIYAALAVGRIPIKLLLIVCIGAIITVFTMIRSLFIKRNKTDPGRPLTYGEAPGLWDLAKNVAAALGTRPVDEIRVTPGTDLAVYESGSRKERGNDRGRRILILGVGVLNDFEQSAFRAVLAHEYGHFSHRDTAGGDVALRVNADMINFARAMMLSGQNVWWNIAFQFLRVYHFIFRRLSHGATRLQEVLADRVAAAKFGAQAFEEGLRHVIRKSAEFEFVANREINESANAKRALLNLYELQSATDPDVDSRANAQLNRQTSEDDTHPSPNERFRLTRRIVTQSEPPISGMVWDLFQDRAALTLEMTTKVQALLHG